MWPPALAGDGRLTPARAAPLAPPPRAFHCAANRRQLLIRSSSCEPPQTLRYEPGQYYRVHHDQNAHPRSPWGPRLFTFFLYLNSVEEGGGTRFPKLNLTVEPRPGRWTRAIGPRRAASRHALRPPSRRPCRQSVVLAFGERRRPQPRLGPAHDARSARGGQGQKVRRQYVAAPVQFPGAARIGVQERGPF